LSANNNKKNNNFRRKQNRHSYHHQRNQFDDGKFYDRSNNPSAKENDTNQTEEINDSVVKISTDLNDLTLDDMTLNDKSSMVCIFVIILK